ncbi:MAG: hypothetical protein JW786_06575 [Desulfobacterales bacterium]|nr:hypothetical protein [Desulfobacterales bacterium]
METSVNRQIAGKLLELAGLLEQQEANPFRVNAFRRAADTVSSLQTSVKEIIAKSGINGLIELPNIGEGIARAIHEMITTGRWVRLERLRGTLEPQKLFQTIPGIGPNLAQRIHDTLSIESLEALETAAYDGRLKRVPGIGLSRLTAIRSAVSEMLSQRLKINRNQPREEPPVTFLLEVDQTYIEKAQKKQLPTIAPKRFNPTAEAWLPIFHTQQGAWHFTALYSNTARAHELGRTHDWVVIYFYDDHHREGQRTVVTETRGELIGKRVVRGREEECRAYYRRA